MVCVYCNKKTQVTNSRISKVNNQVWRRRRCLSCNSLITTHEVPIYDGVLAIRRSNGRLEPFSRDKLLFSMVNSLGHRKKPINEASKLINTVLKQLLSISEAAAVDLDQVTAVTATCLQRFDPLAGQHYTAYHRS